MDGAVVILSRSQHQASYGSFFYVVLPLAPYRIAQVKKPSTVSFSSLREALRPEHVEGLILPTDFAKLVSPPPPSALKGAQSVSSSPVGLVATTGQKKIASIWQT